MSLIQSWRWFGPQDPISLQFIKQAGAKSIVNALHEIPYGEIWNYEDIIARKNIIEAAGLNWKVVESVPLHDDIKLKRGNYKTYIENYKSSLINLAKAGITHVCYNFMLIVDWSRTNLNDTLSNGATAMSFKLRDFIIFDLFVLNRDGAENDYPEEWLEQARSHYNNITGKEIDIIGDSILAGYWSSQDKDKITSLKTDIHNCRNVNKNDLREGLRYFLTEIIPLAEELGIKMAIHPDDPPFSIFGLPRVVSTSEDMDYLINAYASPSNGITFCTGSLGAWEENDLPTLLKKYINKVHFFHLRNVHRSSRYDFIESDHLVGDVDMHELMTIILTSFPSMDDVPYRPDHGHRMLDDLSKEVINGYSAIGRLKGLAELRGLEIGIKRSLKL